MAMSTRRSSRFSMRSKQLGQLLSSNGDITAEQIAKALKIQESEGGLIGQILRQLGACNEQAIANALLKQVQVTDVHCEDLTVNPQVVGLVSRDRCEADKLCPFEQLGNLLCIAMGNPLNRRAINAIEEKTGLKVKPFKSPWPKIKGMIEGLYTDENIAAADDAEEDEDDEAYEEEFEESFEEDFDEDDMALADDGNVLAIPEDDVAAPAEIAPPGEEADLDKPLPKIKRELPPEPTIQGIDDLTDDKAEVIETDKRGLARRRRRRRIVDDGPAKPKVAKKAKVNVNLDELDLDSGEVVKTGDLSEDEDLAEITAAVYRPGAKPSKAAAERMEQIVQLSEAEPSHFYDGPAPSSDEAMEDEALRALVESLPVAEEIAASTEDYRISTEEAVHAEKKARRSAENLDSVADPEADADDVDVDVDEEVDADAPQEEPAVAVAQTAAKPKKDLPPELQPAPLEPVAAEVLSETEFQNSVKDLVEDPVGEWLWKFQSNAPVPVKSYD